MWKLEPQVGVEELSARGEVGTPGRESSAILKFSCTDQEGKRRKRGRGKIDG